MDPLAALRKSMETKHSHTLAARARAALPARPLGLVLVAAVLALPQLAGPGVAALLRYDRGGIAGGQWWRVYTAHVVHYDSAHLLQNLAGLALLWWLFIRDAGAPQWAFVAVASATTVSAGLWFLQPELAWYLGASGVLHGLWAAGGVAARRRWRLESDVALALLAAKLAVEQWRGPLAHGLDAALPVIVDAHLFGAAGGAIAALALRLWREPL